LIYLGPEDTKERHWKRVPIHRDLIPILEQGMKISSLTSDRFFLLQDKSGVREANVEACKNCWPRALKALSQDSKIPKPQPRFHDLRHTWRTNARRSKVDPQIAESILGHWFKGKSVNDRYGYISDEELVQAIDQMTFDNGQTFVFAAGSQKSFSKIGVRKTLEDQGRKRRKAGLLPA
jgi:integrase